MAKFTKLWWMQERQRNKRNQCELMLKEIQQMRRMPLEKERQLIHLPDLIWLFLWTKLDVILVKREMAMSVVKRKLFQGAVPKESATTYDNHFTLLGFNAATGEPVMCAIIIEGKSINSDTVTGIDLFAEKVSNESDPDFVQKNTGPGMLYPLGPTCELKGKQVPCIVAHTDSGSITSELLASFLKHMDDLQVFPQDDPNVKPFLLLDGHGSRLENYLF